MNILFIGGGNMATAMLGGLLQQGLSPSNISVVDPSEVARQQLTSNFGVHTFSADSPLPVADVVVLATKPQQLAAVAQQRAAELAGRLVISIAAGIRMADLDRWLNRSARLIRVMPNTPALVRAGISGAWLGPHATEADRTSADRILSSTGTVVWVEDEARLDAITAISGSGPAYVFFFMESLTDAAIQLGFDAATARQLAYATFDGAIKLAQASTDSAATLREKVTSKGGTTEAALMLMGEKGVQAAIVMAAQAAESRAAELADELGRA
ncbi:pyrroline-5-carboxylate reductase [Chitinimonas sp. BJB300]|uniref:pyrroline-5-carboxylate reductase n=1 Tax=Chitinimonas sp. BJB300 TaxID=1559339 RepID=UPI000C0C6288|nr:pyrroline-5-carboxylate reductase [Chitinimonas sp. BJB300]PHV13204.1 pyrroline-5-carboxylate reductase [Chitinimonas sp. BJB300]TSJ89595.1 pyrroline-5-carboxylate reductase [Chitinimonas sp. BJB300]